MPDTAAAIASRLAGLRTILANFGLDGCVVPRWDAFQGEYVRAADERLAYLTGFTGSWGAAMVLADRAALFVDGRYTVQAAEQVPPGPFEHWHLLDEPPELWLAASAPQGAAIGFDPAVVTPELYGKLEAAVAARGGRMVPFPSDPFDRIWADRPQSPLSEVTPFTDCGEHSLAKRARLGARMAELGLDYVAESQTDNIAWAFNFRGADVDYTPIAHSYALFAADGGAWLFLDEDRLTAPRDAYQFAGVRLRPMATFFEALGQILQPGDRVGVDPRLAPVGVVLAAKASGAEPVILPDPLTRLKAPKNTVELSQMRAASRRDAVAWVQLLRWLDETVPTRAAAGEPLRELDIEEEMLRLRRALPQFVGSSFRTIAASDASGAMCHYAAPPEGGRPVLPESIFLLDVGTQFRDGTTDTTRTVTFAPPRPQVRRAYTAVLQGHIALANLVFPDGSFGHQLDPFARAPLWRLGLDYDHGTGHGVGHHLSVHEFPQRMAKLPSDAPLRAGMTLTNEPGYYETGGYGVRIENLCEIVAADSPGFLRLEPLTLVPINRRLIEPSMLAPAEVAWVDAYHQRVRSEMRALLTEPADRAWLQFATAPLLISTEPKA